VPDEPTKTENEKVAPAWAPHDDRENEKVAPAWAPHDEDENEKVEPGRPTTRMNRKWTERTSPRHD